eukprot:CAMPEP_0198577624 /NCGR_PEP_ID=MMETSP1462-20131121/119159_1 /TAXON_ID=1333877 /ORGANISM="Brandtodinium nutriculum, Strain RCC3387" /LENGTH=37 /DNA_ID= /DNA_START= /DNA_END= /DNA_ORIENTATION=
MTPALTTLVATSSSPILTRNLESSGIPAPGSSSGTPT